MTSDRLLALAAASLWICSGLLSGCGEPAAPVRPNVLLVSIDALRADHLGVHGAAPSPTPFLDELAGESIVFEDASSVASWTKPSVPSMLTGLYPDEHGVFDNSSDHADTLAAGSRPLAAILGEHGYRTAAFVENEQLRSGLSGLDRGFSLYHHDAGSPPQIVQRFLSWSRLGEGRPWFAWLHTLDPHFPYTPDEFTVPERDAARLRTRSLHWDLRGESWWLLRQRVNDGAMILDKQAQDDLDRLYRLEIAAVDSALGALWMALGKEGVLDSTMVIVTSDHGEGFLEHGRIDHGYGPYRELLHIPLIVRPPGGRRGGARSAALAQNVDIAPTVLDAVGIEIPAAWSSRSLLPVIEGRADEVRQLALAREQHGHWQLLGAHDRRYSYIRSEGAVSLRPPTPRVPASAVAGVRVRAQGIFDGRRLVASAVKLLDPGDPDTEIEGPVEAVDTTARTLRLLGTVVRIGEGVAGANEDAGALTIEDLAPGEMVRAHGVVANGVFVPAKIEKTASLSIEIEGVVRSIEPLPGGDVAMDVGGVVILVDPRAHWKGFPGDQPPGDEAAGVAATVEGVSEQLFNRLADPREQRNIALEHPGDLQRLRALADAARLAMNVPAGHEERRAELSSDARERLRALGYVE